MNNYLKQSNMKKFELKGQCVILYTFTGPDRNEKTNKLKDLFSASNKIDLKDQSSFIVSNVDITSFEVKIKELFPTINKDECIILIYSQNDILHCTTFMQDNIELLLEKLLSEDAENISSIVHKINEHFKSAFCKCL